LASEKVSEKQCCQHGTTFCTNPGIFYSKQFEVLGPFIYDVFINYIYSSMTHSKYFSFFDIKIVGHRSCATDCTLLQSDIDSIRR